MCGGGGQKRHNDDGVKSKGTCSSQILILFFKINLIFVLFLNMNFGGKKNRMGELMDKWDK